MFYLSELAASDVNFVSHRFLRDRDDVPVDNVCCPLRILIRPTGSSVKNVVMTGFGDITLLDLDTIDLSNLNRQFLFRKKDVKQSKALVRFI